MDVVLRALKRSDASARLKPALTVGKTQHSYQDLLVASRDLTRTLGRTVERHTSDASRFGPRVATLVDPGPHYVASQWSTWMHGGIFVPLAVSHPTAELEYTITDSEASVILVGRSHLHKVDGVAAAHGIALRVLEDEIDVCDAGSGRDAGLSHIDGESIMAGRERTYHEEGAFLTYTSGTTGKPKGVLHTHASAAAHMESLSNAWHWQENDRILHALPLHHIHGLVNALMCAHYNGATVDVMPKFNALSVWRRLQGGDVSVFMGVPTMYAHLLTIYGKLNESEQARCRTAAAALRLTVSGSAACPLPIMEAWQELSGTIPLERYGMSETGMVLSNPYEGARMAGTVGQPLHGAEVRVAYEDPCGSGADLDSSRNGGGGGGGELQVRGPILFREYWRRAQATAEAFTADGFFRTGDTVDVVAHKGIEYYRILGRTSVDIIKSGGFKISALRIENALLEHPCFAEVAVLGVPDATLGEAVVCIAALKDDGAHTVALADLNMWAADRLPPYELPRDLLILDAIPRNAMGKVNKKQLCEQYLQAKQLMA